MRKTIFGSGLVLLLVQAGFFLWVETSLERNIGDIYRNIVAKDVIYAQLGKNNNSDGMKKSVKKSRVSHVNASGTVNGVPEKWNESRTWLVFPEHLAGAFSGGFGEQSCHSCHFDYDLNMEKGELELRGLEDEIESGKEYEFEVFITRPDLGAAGFQLTARFEDGSQAGSFVLNDQVVLTPNTPGEVEYLQHAIRNIHPDNGSKLWKFTWKAPENTDQPIVFNLAGNAANGDESAFGDYILVREWGVGSGE
jgi:hypothetical protein